MVDLTLKEILKYDRLALNKSTSKPRLVGDEIWRYQINLRKWGYYAHRGHSLIASYYKIKTYVWGLLLGYEIYPESVGPGLSLAHRGPVIINRAARLGRGCRIHSGVNIGTAAGQHRKAPKIGDGVYIGPGAKLFGDICIADNVAIGANAVVNKDVLSACTVGGIPAKKISSKDARGLWIQIDYK